MRFIALFALLAFAAFGFGNTLGEDYSWLLSMDAYNKGDATAPNFTPCRNSSVAGSLFPGQVSQVPQTVRMWPCHGDPCTVTASTMMSIVVSYNSSTWSFPTIAQQGFSASLGWNNHNGKDILIQGYNMCPHYLLSLYNDLSGMTGDYDYPCVGYFGGFNPNTAVGMRFELGSFFDRRSNKWDYKNSELPSGEQDLEVTFTQGDKGFDGKDTTYTTCARFKINVE